MKEVPEDGSNQHISNAKYLKPAFCVAPPHPCKETWAGIELVSYIQVGDLGGSAGLWSQSHHLFE